MRRPRQPLFLARATYRRRRLRDAARLLPVVGVFLLVLPLFWPEGGAGRAVIFVFVVWALLIALAALLAPGLDQPEATPGSGGDD
jgi:peptidoglycan/LPS O-acetylase OafA/YrhL